MARASAALAATLLLPTCACFSTQARSVHHPTRPSLSARALVFPPDNHHREAARIVGNLKSNAALLAAFSFRCETRGCARETLHPKSRMPNAHFARSPAFFAQRTHQDRPARGRRRVRRDDAL